MVVGLAAIGILLDCGGPEWRGHYLTTLAAFMVVSGPGFIILVAVLLEWLVGDRR